MAVVLQEAIPDGAAQEIVVQQQKEACHQQIRLIDTSGKEIADHINWWRNTHLNSNIILKRVKLMLQQIIKLFSWTVFTTAFVPE